MMPTIFSAFEVGAAFCCSTSAASSRHPAADASVVNDGLVPPPYPGDGGDAEGAPDREEFLGGERRLLYVAMTRAKHGLYQLHGSRRSPFLEELDTRLYRTTAPELEAAGAAVPAAPAAATPLPRVDGIEF